VTDADQPAPLPSARDLESMWSGEFGDAYVERNTAPIERRRQFWEGVLAEFPAKRILEVGCAHGEELAHLSTMVEPHDLWGVDINDKALGEVHDRAPGANAVWSLARELPFRDRFFDAVFTIGLLIHQPEGTLPVVMNEIARCSRRWVMCGEYHADEPTDINYRDRPGILFKRDYGRLYQEWIPGLVLRQTRELTTEADGFDRVTWHVLERVD